jgi:hypothetical protein
MYGVTISVVGCVYEVTFVVVVIMDYVGLLLYNVVGYNLLLLVVFMKELFIVVVVVGMDLMGL